MATIIENGIFGQKNMKILLIMLTKLKNVGRIIRKNGEELRFVNVITNMKEGGNV